MSLGVNGAPPARFVWTWRYEDASGEPVSTPTGEGQGFPSQSDAESWLGEIWRDLVDEGVDQVSLFEGDRMVYGPMSLNA
jgi:hypothetical protein